MAKNGGKQFETDFKASVPESVFYYRFKDGTANFNGQKNENVRFQAKNMCDCMLFDGSQLYFFELKQHKGKSLPLGAIRKNQIIELQQASIFENIVAGFIINMSDLEECYYMSIQQFKEFVATNTRKSMPIDFFRQHCVLIGRLKKRTRYTYYVQELLNELK